MSMARQEPVPPGDLTYDEAQRLLDSGESLEVWVGDGYGHTCWHNKPAGTMADAKFAYRRKLTPRTVELGPDDVDLHLDLFRDRGAGKNGVIFTAHSKSKYGLGFSIKAQKEWSWGWIRKHILRSCDNGTSWIACEKEVAQ